MLGLHFTFSRNPTTPLRERRRRRWADTVSTVCAVLGMTLAEAARQIEQFPLGARPYIIAASAAFGAIAVIERLERRHDYQRYVERVREQSDASRTTYIGGKDGGTE